MLKKKKKNFDSTQKLDLKKWITDLSMPKQVLLSL